MLRGLSAPPDFVQAFVAHTEVMADFVKDGLADLFAETGLGEPHPKVGLPVDGDLVGHRPEVVIATVGQHDAFVEPKEVAVFFDLIRARPFFYNHVEVVDALDHPLGQFGEDLVYDFFKLS